MILVDGKREIILFSSKPFRKTKEKDARGLNFSSFKLKPVCISVTFDMH
ncbi:hypothetical protein E1A91_D02G082400v1 [Gossypium mustelinum]|uniref:Uncharacterized protein n=1 Tax=Gossypium mustelinum TaxID=34275 RepID=A0A5D2VTG2_GOSMU|nr:hypothetical protein E1A91_D02G082400v1 [Gossypium mustelinum]